MNILVNFGDWNYNAERKRQNTYGGVGYYRLIKPAQQIKSHNVTVWGQEIAKQGTTLEEQWQKVFTDFDVYWTNYFCDPEAGAAIMFMRDQLKKKVVIDVDDNYLDILESNPLYERFQRGKRDRAFMSTILSFADVITVSTEPLKERIHEHMHSRFGLTKKIVVLPNMNDAADWAFKPAKKHKDRVVIGYSASNSHQDDLLMVMPHIRAVMEKHKHVWFESIGTIEEKMIPHYFRGFSDEMLNRCVTIGATQTFKEYPAYLAKQKWDIGIAPLVDTSFTRCKSHIKWMEYSMYAIPTVASRVYPYFMEAAGRKTIIDGQTGLLVKPQDWPTALEHLVTDADLRAKLGHSAQEFVKEAWQYKDFDFDSVVSEMLE